MKTLPIVAIVGRPNVGKSALFNAIINKRKAIVDEHDGITRDRIYGLAECFGTPFTLVDTGGMPAKRDIFADEITQQAQYAIEEADAIIHVVDGRVGVQALDIEVAKRLRRTKKQIILAVNKIDNETMHEGLFVFSALGIHPIIPISAIHKYNIAELLEAIDLPKRENIVTTPHPNVAVVGRPNVGKSMLINTLLGESRCIVSPQAGTTRDAIDTTLTYEGKQYTFVDTAGIRRTHKEREVVEKFATLRTEQAIERADLCLLMADVHDGFTTEEKRIAKSIEQAGKGCVVALNKWDCMHNVRMEHALRALQHETPFLTHCPKLFISAKTGRNINRLFTQFDTVFTSLHARITTHTLNKALAEWLRRYHPPMIHGKRLRIYYMTQVAGSPPHFVLFVNAPHYMDPSYKRYITNRIRETFSFEGVPFQFTLRGKKRGKHAPTTHTLDKDIGHVVHAYTESNPCNNVSSSDLDSFLTI